VGEDEPVVAGAVPRSDRAPAPFGTRTSRAFPASVCRVRKAPPQPAYDSYQERPCTSRTSPSSKTGDPAARVLAVWRIPSAPEVPARSTRRSWLHRVVPHVATTESASYQRRGMQEPRVSITLLVPAARSVTHHRRPAAVTRVLPSALVIADPSVRAGSQVRVPSQSRVPTRPGRRPVP
jgi:hypothetical protein